MTSVKVLSYDVAVALSFVTTEPLSEVIVRTDVFYVPFTLYLFRNLSYYVSLSCLPLRTSYLISLNPSFTAPSI